MKLKPTENVELQKDLSEMLEKVSWHGRYFSCLCVFHDNKDTPAMMVYPDGFSCKSCGEFGNLDKLRNKITGSVIRYREKDEDAPEQERPTWKKWLKDYGSYEAAAVHAYLTATKYPILMRYLVDRGFGQIIEQGYIGYLDGWLSFPVFHNNRMVDWVVRSTPTLETSVKYAVRPRNKGEGFGLYSADWDRIDNSNKIYVPFGILDMWALHLKGLPVATGLTGKAYNLLWFNDIRKKIYLIPDAGEEDAAWKFKQQLGWRGDVILLNYPEGTKDCADIYTRYGLRELEIKLFGEEHVRSNID